ncbi:MAG: hypothetical protein WBO45_07995 [Planctomycetota bacterium]
MLPALLLLGGLVGCRAQDDRKTLQSSVTRLEQRLTKMDEYLKSLQAEKAQQTADQQKTLQDREAELVRLRQVVAEHERAAKDRAVAQERERAEWKAAVAQQKESLAAEQGKLKKQLDEERARLAERGDADRKKLQAEIEALRDHQRRAEAQAAELQDRARAQERRSAEAERAARAVAEHHAQELEQRSAAQAQERKALEARARDLEQAQKAERDSDRGSLLEKLISERREVEKLRAAVQDDIARARARDGDRARQSDEGVDRLRAENQGLRDKLAAMERELLKAKAGAFAVRATDRPADRGQDQPGPMRGAQRTAPAPTAAAAPMPPPHAAPGGGGTIVVNNEKGEVHIHIHGGSPTVVTHGNAPRVDGGPGKQPKVAPPAPKKKAKAHGDEDEDENEDDDDGDDPKPKARQQTKRAAMFRLLSPGEGEAIEVAPLRLRGQQPFEIELRELPLEEVGKRLESLQLKLDQLGEKKAKGETKPKAPKKDAAKAKDEPQPKERRINDEDAAPIAHFVQLLLGAF